MPVKVTPEYNIFPERTRIPGLKHSRAEAQNRRESKKRLSKEADSLFEFPRN